MIQANCINVLGLGEVQEIGLQLIKQTRYAVVSKETFPKGLVPNPPTHLTYINSTQEYKKIADRCVALEMNCNPSPNENLFILRKSRAVATLHF